MIHTDLFRDGQLAVTGNAPVSTGPYDSIYGDGHVGATYQAWGWRAAIDKARAAR